LDKLYEPAKQHIRVTGTAAEETVQDVFHAMAAAEAVQAACMATGRLAEEAGKGSKAATELLQAYSTAQQLYHKTYRRFLERYQQLAVTPAGGRTLLACLCTRPHCLGIYVELVPQYIRLAGLLSFTAEAV